MTRFLVVMIVLLSLGGWTADAHTQEEKSFYLQSRMVLQLNPRDAVAGNAVGTWHLEYNEREKSRTAFEAVLAQHPGDFLARTGMALLAEAGGKFQAALNRAAAISGYPAAFAPFVELVKGRLFLQAGQQDKAGQTLLQALRGAMAEKQELHDYYLWLGRYSEAARKDLEAIAYYRKAIAADPFWMESHSRLSLIHQRRGERERAAQALREIAGLDNPSPYPNNDIMLMWRWVMRTQPSGR